MYEYKNPVISGYSPDPSICRVEDDYYLVTSSFEFFPGVPIYHSRNLVEWELISYCLTRDSQLKLSGCRNSGGIYAPTIRYHDGTFFMTTTNITDKGNFIVHTKDVRGEWSEPMWVDQGGIDPSLLFDDDGKVYFCSTLMSGGKSGIGLSQVDPISGVRLTDVVIIHKGSGGKFPEAPHLYKINGMYYLMLAEGGTEYGHMETIFRGKTPYGPYEPCPTNPILSHKDYMGSPIQATGHADLIEDQNGQWWGVCLGIRPLGFALLHNLGRETFLAPVTWTENGWPVIGDRGRIDLVMKGELPSAVAKDCGYGLSFHDEFDKPSLHLEWNHVRNPKRDNYVILDEGRGLRMKADRETLQDDEPTYIGIRQRGFQLAAESKVISDLKGQSPKAGITAYYNNCYHYEIYVTRKQEDYFVELKKAVHDISAVTESVSIDYHGEIGFKIETGKESYHFYYRTGDEWIRLGSGATAGLCTEGTMHMTFTGTYLGLFCSDTTADFSFFRVDPLD